MGLANFERGSVVYACERGACLLKFLKLFRDRLIGRTSAFEAEYRGSSPRPGTKFFF